MTGPRSLLLILLSLGGLSAAAAAQDYNDSVFALHLKPPFTPSPEIPNLCPDPGDTTAVDYSPISEGLSCCDYTVSGPIGEESTVYVVLGNSGSRGIAGASFGIVYGDTLGTTGVGIEGDLVTWTGCNWNWIVLSNSGGFGDFPYPKGGIRVIWSECEEGAYIPSGGWHYVLGALTVYAYSADVLAVTPNNNVETRPELVIADCTGTEYDLLSAKPGYPPSCFYPKVGFGVRGSEGYTPCCTVCIAPARRSTWGGVKTRYGP